MTEDTSRQQPVSGADLPRYAGAATFMRLPQANEPGELDIALIGVPFDGGTTNRPGARLAPREIRDASTLIRMINSATGVAPYDLCNVADLGDVPINPVDLIKSLKNIEDTYDWVCSAGAAPVTAGGDHLISLPILRGLARHQPLGMVHFDAHSDTGDTYFGGSALEHGTPFRRAVEEGLLDPKRVIQIGIRGSLYQWDDVEWARDQGFRVVTIDELYDIGVDAVIAEARRVVGDGPTYVSFDVDGLDPAYAPGTGTPEIGGFTTFEATKMLRGLRGLNLIGGDVVEVSPPYDTNQATAIVGATLMFEIICLLAEALASERQRKPVARKTVGSELAHVDE